VKILERESSTQKWKLYRLFIKLIYLFIYLSIYLFIFVLKTYQCPSTCVQKNCCRRCVVGDIDELKLFYWGRKEDITPRRTEKRRRLKVLLENAHHEYLKELNRNDNDPVLKNIVKSCNKFIFKIGSAIVCDRSFQIILGIYLTIM
jgi:hypothetical protein